MMNGNGGINTHLPMFDGKDWRRWSTQMRVLFGAQDVLDYVNDGFTPLAENATEAQRNAHREVRKKDQKALFYIHQCVDANVFEKIAEATTAKSAWDTLVRCYGGDVNVKKVKLQSLRKQYELLQMKEGEKIADYVTQVITVTNQMKACGEALSEQTIVEKVLRSLNSHFDYVVTAIEQSKDTSTIKIDELQGNLEAHEMRIKDRTTEKENEQALKAQTSMKGEHNKKKWQNKKGKENWNKNRKNYEKETSKPKEGSSGKYDNSKKKGGFDKKKIQCWNCERYDHFADECWGNKGNKQPEKVEEANAVQGDSDSDPMLLMVTVNEEIPLTDYWYMDTGCSNHMTGRRDWVTNLRTSKRARIRLADHRSLQAEGMGDIVIKRKNGRDIVIENVWYVPPPSRHHDQQHHVHLKVMKKIFSSSHLLLHMNLEA